MEFREILIGHKGSDFVSILPGAAGAEGWFDAVICVQCDAFSGTFKASFMIGELSQLADDLQRLEKELTRVATLEPIEPNLKMKFIGDGKGHIDVTGEAYNRLPGAYLHFEFEIDQTYLAGIVAALSANETIRSRSR